MQETGRLRRPYGLWESPLSPGRLALRLGLTDVQWAGAGQLVVWHEERADRGVLSAWREGEVAARDLVVDPPVRARLGYGGGHFGAGPDAVIFVSSGRLFRRDLAAGPPRPITPPFGQAALPALSPDGRWVAFVHSDGETDVLACVPAGGEAWPARLVAGDDFYMQPAWHPSGQQLAFVAWNHPRMPWEGSLLQLAELEADGGRLQLRRVRTLAGGDDTPVFQPAFSPDGRYLAFVAEVDGWFNVHLLRAADGQPVAVVRDEAEHAVAAWRQGMRTLAWSADSRRLYYVRNHRGFAQLCCYDLEAGRARPVQGLEAYTLIEQPAVAQPALAPGGAGDGVGSGAGHRAGAGAGHGAGCAARADRLAFLGSAAGQPTRLVLAEIDPATLTAQSVRVLRYTDPEDLPAGLFAQPRPVSWAAADGSLVFGLYYPPTNPRFVADGLPPAIVRVHGGPTAQARPGWSPEVQFFTSRGYAVLEVNYRGSTGYGRAYRKALEGRWGVVDVEDCVSAARFLGEQALADPTRLAMAGASAGGFTVLRTLILYPGVFRAALCQFGVTDLVQLAQQTHKFERHYLDSLVGPLPQAAALYRERSPLLAAERIQDPVAIFQGDQDPVVPKSQADRLVEALRRRGVPHEYHVFAGEGHGWRQPHTIEAYLRAAEAFLRRHLLLS